MLITARDITASLLALGLGLMWLWAGTAKIRTPSSADHGLNVRIRWLAPFLTRVLPFIEIMLGAALVTGVRLREAALLSAGLLALFTFVQCAAIVRGSNADAASAGCGCFGTAKPSAAVSTTGLRFGFDRVSRAEERAAWLLVRNLTLTCIAWAVAMHYLFGGP